MDQRDIERHEEAKKQYDEERCNVSKFADAADWYVELLEAQLEAARAENEMLRRYGNKDCTAMADEELERERGATG